MSLTYSTLITQVLNFCERSDTTFVNSIPEFIARAQDRINTDLGTLILEIYVTGAFEPGNAVIPKPARWRRTITFNFGNGVTDDFRNNLKLRRYEYLLSYWPDRTETGTPIYYADYGPEHFLIAPTPDLAYPFELGYMETPSTLSLANQTNWMTNYAPSLLFYATLTEAIPYLKNDGRVQLIESKYQSFLQPMIKQDRLRLVDRGSYVEAD